ncbi:siphovirus Gp157 family protein [Ruminococcus sp.]|uniref:siphovirus Gp157 family protein n=1 Tax=Ruminococcus sp. TaxID=41978 RepID=UPI00388F0BA7
MNLYEMTEAAKQLYEMLAAGDIPEEAVADTLESFGVEGKVEDYCHVIYQLMADADMYAAEMKRLEAKKKSAEKGVERMKSALSAYMQATGSKKMSAGTFTLSFRKSESVLIKDEFAIPAEYLKTKTSVDKTAIKNAIKSGQMVAGAELQTNQNLQIK